MAKELVLIVDDEVGMRQYLEKLLGDNGFDVHGVSDGLKALAWLNLRVPSLVLADLKMPKMDGLELLEKIKKMPQCAGTPVVIMTAYGTVESAIEAMKLGAEDYVRKPFDMDEILLIISRALDKRRLEQENIVLEFLRDFEMAREKRGLVFETAGSVNQGTRITSMRLAMAAIQRFGRY